MKHSDDIVNLFQQFGASAEPYVELARQQEHKRSNERWPLISAVNAAGLVDVPSVNRGAMAAPQRRMADVFASPAVAPAAPVALQEKPLVNVPSSVSKSPVQSVAAMNPKVHAQAASPLVSPVMQRDSLPQSNVVHKESALQTMTPAGPTANTLQGRSPLAGLASQRATLESVEAVAPSLSTMTVDLSSIFARLEKADQMQDAFAAPVKAVWQPRKGLT